MSAQPSDTQAAVASPATAATAAAEPLKEYTREEVRNEGNKRLIIIDNYVVDISEFAAEHPGGLEVLEPYFGLDATAAFHGVAHSSMAFRMMKKRICGVLCAADQA